MLMWSAGPLAVAIWVGTPCKPDLEAGSLDTRPWLVDPVCSVVLNTSISWPHGVCSVLVATCTSSGLAEASKSES